MTKLAQVPLCEDCTARGLVTPANEVDHVHGDTSDNRMDALASLCKPCHSSRTAKTSRATDALRHVRPALNTPPRKSAP